MTNNVYVNENIFNRVNTRNCRTWHSRTRAYKNNVC